MAEPSRPQIIAFDAGHSHAIWQDAQEWCRKNPGKRAAIVTSEGVFTLTFTVGHASKLKGRADD